MASKAAAACPAPDAAMKPYRNRCCRACACASAPPEVDANLPLLEMTPPALGPPRPGRPSSRSAG
eukprot:7692259-Pyramimonas_sp.AAC.1